MQCSIRFAGRERLVYTVLSAWARPATDLAVERHRVETRIPSTIDRNEEKLMRSFVRLACLWLGTIALLAGSAPAVSAQDLEPNNGCFSPQDVGAIVPPVLVTGSLDVASATASTDIDFFRLSTAPGTALSVMAGFNQRVGLFTDQCLLVTASDFSFENRIDFTVPASGTFILAVADRFDNNFNGGGFAFSDAPYQLTIMLQPPSIGSISGRLVDAVAKTPLVGAMSPFGTVELRRCINGSCFDFLGRQNTDDAGRFRFELDFSGRRITVGSFMLIATADEFQQVTLMFDVDADQNLTLGDVALIPPPILFSNIRPCTAILPQGGTCQYSVSVRNNTTGKLTGQALSLVTGGFGSTRFEASTQRSGSDPRRAPVSIPALSSRDVTFFFTVPSFVPNNTAVCVAAVQRGPSEGPVLPGQGRLRLPGDEQRREPCRLRPDEESGCSARAAAEVTTTVHSRLGGCVSPGRDSVAPGRNVRSRTGSRSCRTCRCDLRRCPHRCR
jgi:hypothetical protein